MDFFKSGSSPLIGRRYVENEGNSDDDSGVDPSSETNLFSYYFMLRTGKGLDPIITDITKKFIMKARSSTQPVKVKSQEVQQFYKFMTEKLQNFPFFEGYNSETIDKLVVGMERFVMVNIHANVFNATEDLQQNVILDEKIRSLHWILPKHLDFNLPQDNELTDRQLALAQYYLLEMSKKRSPHDKVSCIVLCCKALHELLKVANSNEAGADEFLPILIYSIIVAAPSNLHSTIQYIDRFYPSERLTSGETGYNFTNMCCAIQFLENVTPEKLTLSNDEYDRYMDGHSSHLEEAMSNKFASGLLDNISKAKDCEEKLKQLQGYQSKLRDNTAKLQVDLEKEKNDFNKSVSEVKSKYSMVSVEVNKILNDDY